MLLTVGTGAAVLVVGFPVVVLAVQTPGVVVTGAGATGGFFFMQSDFEQALPVQVEAQYVLILEHQV